MIRILDEEGHPIIGEILVTLRDVGLQGRRDVFRAALRRVGQFLGYEIARGLPTSARLVTTPLGSRHEPVLAKPPVLATVLRAGLPLWEGLLEVFRDSDSIILGASRIDDAVNADNGLLEIDFSYMTVVPLEGRTLIYADPMLATGSTLRKVHSVLVRKAGRPERVVVAGVVAYRKTLESLAAELPADILVASADDEIDARGYIVPGLGDAGDLAFGIKRR